MPYVKQVKEEKFKAMRSIETSSGKAEWEADLVFRSVRGAGSYDFVEIYRFRNNMSFCVLFKLDTGEISEHKWGKDKEAWDDFVRGLRATGQYWN